MMQFLVYIFEALAGFALLSLGLSMTAETPECVAEVELVPADYFIAEYTYEPDSPACLTGSSADDEAVEVFRI